MGNPEGGRRLVRTVCGIVGIWEFRRPVDRALVESMRDTLTHRGPDDHGVFIDPSGQLGLGHRRLSILDLTPAGRQPMGFDDVWTVHNGEIYNFHEIRDRLIERGHTFHSRSDTEVIIHAYREWGLEAVQQFRGMFAIALWDGKERKLHLLRDRAGVKPLYFCRSAERFMFASELRAILAHPEMPRQIDGGAIELYLKLAYVPAPRTIFRDVNKLEAGHILTVDAEGRVQDREYWSVFDCYRRRPDHVMAEREAVEELERILTESYELRMVSDVPVGVFLSGGIDSSTVAALLQKNATSRIETFTIGFTDRAYDEAKAAKAVADHLGTDHHELYLDPRTALEIIPRLPDIYDEPFGDASGIPTYLVSKFARQHVKVALSADGGDELFAGYRMHLNQLRAYRLFSRLGPLRRTAVAVAGTFPVRALLEARMGNMELKLKKLKAASTVGGGMSRFFWAGKSMWTDAEIGRLLGADFGATEPFIASFMPLESQVNGFVDYMRAADYRSYLADDLLVKVDRASMAVSLESRDPFLDHHIVEFVAGLPTRYLLRGGQAKYLLRCVLYRYVPREIVERPKQGFTIPLDLWLKNELRPLLTDYINEARIRGGGVFDWKVVSRELADFLSGRMASSTRIWLVLEYEMWRERWGA